MNNSTNYIPSRRPCIKGAGCQQNCCTMKTDSSKYEKSRSLRSDRSLDVKEGKYASDRELLSTDDDELGEDTVDGEILFKKPPAYFYEKDGNDIRKRQFNDQSFDDILNFKSQNQRYGVKKSPQIQDVRKKIPNMNESPIIIVSRPVNKVWLLAVLAVVAMILYYLTVFSTAKQREYTYNDFKRDIKVIGTEYRINEDSLFRIQKGIESTFKENDTVSIMLLYRNMDEKVLAELVNKIAKASAKYLRTGKGKPIILKHSDLKMQSNKELIDKYREDLEDQGVVLFQNLEKIPVNLVKAFHYYCDEYNPLAEKTAIFFTLDLAKCKQYVDKKKVEVVEICLKDKWKTMDKDEMLPLIARVVNVVVDLEENTN